jgi:hypothetical protein
MNDNYGRNIVKNEQKWMKIKMDEQNKKDENFRNGRAK